MQPQGGDQDDSPFQGTLKPARSLPIGRMRMTSGSSGAATTSNPPTTATTPAVGSMTPGGGATSSGGATGMNVAITLPDEFSRSTETLNTTKTPATANAAAAAGKTHNSFAAATASTSSTISGLQSVIPGSPVGLPPTAGSKLEKLFQSIRKINPGLSTTLQAKDRGSTFETGAHNFELFQEFVASQEVANVAIDGDDGGVLFAPVVDRLAKVVQVRKVYHGMTPFGGNTYDHFRVTPGGGGGASGNASGTLFAGYVGGYQSAPSAGSDVHGSGGGGGPGGGAAPMLLPQEAMIVLPKHLSRNEPNHGLKFVNGIIHFEFLVPSMQQATMPSASGGGGGGPKGSGGGVAPSGPGSVPSGAGAAGGANGALIGLMPATPLLPGQLTPGQGPMSPQLSHNVMHPTHVATPLFTSRLWDVEHFFASLKQLHLTVERLDCIACTSQRLGILEQKSKMTFLLNSDKESAPVYHRIGGVTAPNVVRVDNSCQLHRCVPATETIQFFADLYERLPFEVAAKHEGQSLTVKELVVEDPSTFTPESLGWVAHSSQSVRTVSCRSSQKTQQQLPLRKIAKAMEEAALLPEGKLFNRHLNQHLMTLEQRRGLMGIQDPSSSTTNPSTSGNVGGGGGNGNNNANSVQGGSNAGGSTAGGGGGGTATGMLAGSMLLTAPNATTTGGLQKTTSGSVNMLKQALSNAASGGGGSNPNSNNNASGGGNSGGSTPSAAAHGSPQTATMGHPSTDGSAGAGGGMSLNGGNPSSLGGGGTGAGSGTLRPSLTPSGQWCLPKFYELRFPVYGLNEHELPKMGRFLRDFGRHRGVMFFMAIGLHDIVKAWNDQQAVAAAAHQLTISHASRSGHHHHHGTKPGSERDPIEIVKPPPSVQDVITNIFRPLFVSVLAPEDPYAVGLASLLHSVGGLHVESTVAPMSNSPSSLNGESVLVDGDATSGSNNNNPTTTAKNAGPNVKFAGMDELEMSRFGIHGTSASGEAGGDVTGSNDFVAPDVPFATRLARQPITECSEPFFDFLIWANLKILNFIRVKKGWFPLQLRRGVGIPGGSSSNSEGAGSVGNVQESDILMSLLTGYMFADVICNASPLSRFPVLQYLCGFHQVGLTVSPTSDNDKGGGSVIFMNTPLNVFLQRGLMVTLATEEPQIYHPYTTDALLQEYATAQKLCRLEALDMTELARNSVLMSSFPYSDKEAWLGRDWMERHGKFTVDASRCHVTSTRVKLRRDGWLAEEKMMGLLLQKLQRIQQQQHQQKRAANGGVGVGAGGGAGPGGSSLGGGGGGPMSPGGGAGVSGGTTNAGDANDDGRSTCRWNPLTSVKDYESFQHTDSRISFPRVVIGGTKNSKSNKATSNAARRIAQALRLRAKYIWAKPSPWKDAFDTSSGAGATGGAGGGAAGSSTGAKNGGGGKSSGVSTEEAFKRKTATFDEDQWTYEAKDAIFVAFKKNQVRNWPRHIPTLEEFHKDLFELKAICDSVDVKDFSNERLEFLEQKFHLHLALNHANEAGGAGVEGGGGSSGGAGKKSGPGGAAGGGGAEGGSSGGGAPTRDFYHCAKVDTHVHMAAGMTARQIRDFLIHKMKYNSDDIVAMVNVPAPAKPTGTPASTTGRAGGGGPPASSAPPAPPQQQIQTLAMLLKKMNVNHNLTVDQLSVQADHTLFERFDNFNSKYNPMGIPDLRTMLLKTDNFMNGRYFAELTNLTFAQFSKDRYTFAENRLSVYGTSMGEWSKLSEWFDTHGMASKHNKWMVQVPRVYAVFRKMNMIGSFGQYLQNIFKPLWDVSLHPADYPRLHHFLMHVSGFDSVDDESTLDAPFVDTTPWQWTQADNPPYNYYMYHFWANIRTLNEFRSIRGLPPFDFRPHCGESGSDEHLVGCLLTANAINHGINLKNDPSLQYLYYLTQIGLAVSPLSNNALFVYYLYNPFAEFFRRGLNVSLSTDDPLMFHQTTEPLIEEYSIAAKVWGFTLNDMCEIARNSALQSGFDAVWKRQYLGNRFFLSSSLGNDPNKTHLSDIRVAFRFETYHAEIAHLETAAFGSVANGGNLHRNPFAPSGEQSNHGGGVGGSGGGAIPRAMFTHEQENDIIEQEAIMYEPIQFSTQDQEMEVIQRGIEAMKQLQENVLLSLETARYQHKSLVESVTEVGARLKQLAARDQDVVKAPPPLLEYRGGSAGKNAQHARYQQQHEMAVKTARRHVIPFTSNPTRVAPETPWVSGPRGNRIGGGGVAPAPLTPTPPQQQRTGRSPVTEFSHNDDDDDHHSGAEDRGSSVMNNVGDRRHSPGSPTLGAQYPWLSTYSSPSDLHGSGEIVTQPNATRRLLDRLAAMADQSPLSVPYEEDAQHQQQRGARHHQQQPEAVRDWLPGILFDQRQTPLSGNGAGGGISSTYSSTNYSTHSTLLSPRSGSPQNPLGGARGAAAAAKQQQRLKSGMNLPDDKSTELIYSAIEQERSWMVPPPPLESFGGPSALGRHATTTPAGTTAYSRSTAGSTRPPSVSGGGGQTGPNRGRDPPSLSGGANARNSAASSGTGGQPVNGRWREPSMFDTNDQPDPDE